MIKGKKKKGQKWWNGGLVWFGLVWGFAALSGWGSQGRKEGRKEWPKLAKCGVLEIVVAHDNWDPSKFGIRK